MDINPAWAFFLVTIWFALIPIILTLKNLKKIKVSNKENKGFSEEGVLRKTNTLKALRCLLILFILLPISIFPIQLLIDQGTNNPSIIPCIFFWASLLIISAKGMHTDE